MTERLRNHQPEIHPISFYNLLLPDYVTPERSHSSDTHQHQAHK